jgi:hypothetical protein
LRLRDELFPNDDHLVAEHALSGIEQIEPELEADWE